MLEIDGLILDMDGVLWQDAQPMPGLPEFFLALRRMEIGFILATNNATRTIAQYVVKLAGMGVQVEPDQILTSAYATADYMTTVALPGARVFAVGEAGVVDALTSRGFCLTAEAASYVVAGLDREFTYEKMSTAATLIRRGAQFVGTNPDLTLPTPNGPLPGAGAVLAAISAASGATPLVIGKPQPMLFEQAMAKLGTRPQRTAMVGDRLETDIQGGINAGIRTILVLSGVTGRGDLARSTVQPDWVFPDIRGITEALLA